MTLYPTLLWAVVIVLGVLLYLSKRGARLQASSDELRGRLAQTVTTWALIAIALLGIVIIVIAGYNASIPSTDVEARREFLDAAKYVFASVLPVVAAWVGTVMAFYFGKENFKAATDSVSRSRDNSPPRRNWAKPTSRRSGNRWRPWPQGSANFTRPATNRGAGFESYNETPCWSATLLSQRPAAKGKPN